MYLKYIIVLYVVTLKQIESPLLSIFKYSFFIISDLLVDIVKTLILSLTLYSFDQFMIWLVCATPQGSNAMYIAAMILITQIIRKSFDYRFVDDIY